jgi:Na+/glutamate symporter
MLFGIILAAMWGCMYDLDPSCPQKLDMSNASSTLIGIIIGALIGGIITWWVYRMQNKTSEKQETVIENIDKMVKKMDRQEEKHRAHQDEVLNKILSLDSKIDSILEKKDK